MNRLIEALDEIAYIAEDARAHTNDETVVSALKRIEELYSDAIASENAPVFVKKIERCRFCGESPVISGRLCPEGWRVGIYCECDLHPSTDDMVMDTFEDALALAVEQWNPKEGGTK